MSNTSDLYDRFVLFIRPNSNLRIDKLKQISVWELVVVYDDGSRYIYDDMDQTARYYRPRDPRFEGLDEDEWREEFAHQVRRRMRLKGLNQKQLAEEVMISDMSMSNYLNCKRTPNGYIIERFARVFGCPISELVDFGYLYE